MLTPYFKLVFLTVLGLTLLSLAIAFYLVLYAPKPLTDETKQLADTCSTCWKMGFGAIVGLIAGKAT